MAEISIWHGPGRITLIVFGMLNGLGWGWFASVVVIINNKQTRRDQLFYEFET